MKYTLQGMKPNNAVLCQITFTNKSITNKKSHHSNIEREALGTLHGLKKFHHCCFAHKASVITDHKSLIAIFNKDVVSLIIQTPMSTSMHPSVQRKILYKHWPHSLWIGYPDTTMKQTDEEIPGMCITINTIKPYTDIPYCMTAEEIRRATQPGRTSTPWLAIDKS